MKIRETGRRVGAWYKRHSKKVWLGALGVMVLSVAAQMLYPYDRALPFASVAGESVGWQKRPEITLAAQERFRASTVTMTSGEQSETVGLAELGARVDADAMATHAVEYPMIFRVVPFSALWYQPQLDRYRLSFDDTRLAEMSAEYAELLSVDATNAGLAIESGELEVTAADNGQAVSAERVAEALKTASYNWDETTVAIDNTVVEPRVSDASVTEIRQQAETILSQELTVRIIDQRTFSPTREMLASWIALEADDDGMIRLASDTAALDEYVDMIAGVTTRQPSDTVVSLVDDKETDRQEGREGLGIDPAELRQQLEQTVEFPQEQPRTVTLERQPIEPPISYERSYTSSRAGLEAYVKDAASKNISIAVQQLDGRKWQASGNGDVAMPAASTYKLYVMLRVFDDLAARGIKWRDMIGQENLRTCFERMIVESANACAEALIKRYGADDLNEYLERKGFSDETDFTNKKAVQTTADDLLKLLVGIENNQLVRARYHNMLFEKMSRQVYRQGIPAGAGADATVYNKVGFLWDYLHDAAIVDHPDGDYALVIMTRNQSWDEIADITRDVEAILYGSGVSAASR